MLSSPGAIRSLPLLSWARRFQNGKVSLTGHLSEPVALASLRVEPGALELEVDFIGGEKPLIEEVRARGSFQGVRAKGLVARFLPTAHWLDGEHVGELTGGLGEHLEPLIDTLADVCLRAEARPLAEVALEFPAGMEIWVPGLESLWVTGQTKGPGRELQLIGPLEVSIGGSGLRVSHRQLRWLANAAQVSVNAARLHPDGSVDLEGAARGRPNPLLRGGLDLASEGLTQFVRTAPQFARVRSFLRDD